MKMKIKNIITDIMENINESDEIQKWKNLKYKIESWICLIFVACIFLHFVFYKPTKYGDHYKNRELILKSKYQLYLKGQLYTDLLNIIDNY